MTENEGAGPEETPAEMPAARLGRGFFSPPDVPGVPAHEYPDSASPFYSAALSSLELDDAGPPDRGGAITELLEMLDDDDDDGRPDAPPSPAVAPPVDVPAVARTPHFQPVHADSPAPAAPDAPPPVATAPDGAALPPQGALPTEAAPPQQAPVRIPAPVAPCDMCGMTVPIDPERGRCHLGHRLDIRTGEGRRGRSR